MHPEKSSQVNKGSGSTGVNRGAERGRRAACGPDRGQSRESRSLTLPYYVQKNIRLVSIFILLRRLLQ
jgi:hypothetical protein